MADHPHMPADIPRLFVSYSREDAEFALKLGTDLRARGTNIWMDQLDIRTGARWDSDVEEGLKASPGLLVILTPSSVASQNVMDEVAFALSEGKWILPVRYKPCAIPFRLRRLQYVDFVVGYDEGLRRLVSDIAATFVAQPAAATTSATPPPANAGAPAPLAPPAVSAQPAAVVRPEPLAPPSPPRPEPWHVSPAESAPPVQADVTRPLFRRWRSLSLAKKAIAALALVALVVTALGVVVGEFMAPIPVDSGSQSSPDSAPAGDPAQEPVSATPPPQAAPPASSWTPGAKHSQQPHVVAAEKEGDWTPENGYQWVDAGAAGDLRVRWAAGSKHAHRENVVASDQEGRWSPAPGYEWVNAEEASDMRVRLKPRAAE